MQNYQRIDDAVRWRSSENIPPPSHYIGSPYDEEAHYSKKRSTTWVGYKVHLTESCEAHLPLPITHVETTSAPVSDDAMTAPIHAELERKELLPSEHIVDTGYVDAKLLVESERDYHLDLVGPTRKNYHWQASQKTGYDASHFPIDCVALDILESKKRICNISPRLSLLMSFAVWHGSMACLVLRLDVLLLLACMMSLRKVRQRYRERTRADEFMITTLVYGHENRVRVLELLAQTFGLEPRNVLSAR